MLENYLAERTTQAVNLAVIAKDIGVAIQADVETGCREVDSREAYACTLEGLAGYIRERGDIDFLVDRIGGEGSLTEKTIRELVKSGRFDILLNLLIGITKKCRDEL